MNLTDEQLKLLHAHLDGELNDAETEEAQELLEDSGAREYFDTFLKLRGLVGQYSKISAPDSLKAHVLSKIKPEPISQLDDYRWRGGWIAAAAAVVVSVGLIFGFGNEPDAPERAVALESFTDGSSPAFSTAEPDSDGFDTPDEDHKHASDRPTSPDEREDQRGNKGGDSHAENNSADESDNTNHVRKDVVSGNRKSVHKRMVLNLDRGRIEPMSLNLHLNRTQTISVDQAYNELLVVSAMYGQAELQETDDFDDAEDDFEGNDFSSIEGILISVPEHELAELLASVARMADDQNFGRVAVPEDLSRCVRSIGQSLRHEVASKKLALGYAPKRTREELAEQKIGNTNPDSPEPTGNQSEGEPAPMKSRKIKLLLRLR